jgi:putative sterol carrier protein
MTAFATQEWLDVYRARINGSEAYRQAAASWEGAVAFVFEAEPDQGWPQTSCAVLDLWHGECRAAHLVPREEAEDAPFVVRAPFTRWRQVIAGELDPIKGMMQGKLRLAGDLPTIVRHVRAAKELVDLAAGIPTEFPDGA